MPVTKEKLSIVNRAKAEKCFQFLEKNGWEATDEGKDYVCFGKEGSVGVHIEPDSIVLIGDEGDFLHLPLNKYALIGALIEYRQLPINYKSP